MDLSKMLIMTPDELRVNPNFRVTTQSEAEEIGRLAKDKDPRALFFMGNQFDARRNFEVAASFYSQAAVQGYAPAEHYLALCYLSGDGVEQDEEKAKYWMAEAANDGDATAALFLGTHYDETLGDDNDIPFDDQDDELSSYWYLVAAKLGSKQGMYNIAYNYANGVGIQKDETSAIYFYNKAALAGFQPAIEFLRDRPKAKWDKEFFKFVEEDAHKHKMIKFGKYKISDRNKEEQIPWIVLKENDNAMLCISKYALECKALCGRDGSDTWVDSELREFLNNDFIEKAFSKKEINKLLTLNNRLNSNPVYMTNCAPCDDLVSIPDALFVTAFLNDDEMICEASNASTIIKFSSSNACSWWLRNAGEKGTKRDMGGGIIFNDRGFYCTVNDSGKIDYQGSGVSTSAYGVRPIIMIKKHD